MKFTGVVIFASLLLAACSTSEPQQSRPAATAPNAFDYCRSQGVKTGTDEFSQCMEQHIAEQCQKGGQAGTKQHQDCVTDMKNQALVRDQLQMRGR